MSVVMPDVEALEETLTAHDFDPGCQLKDGCKGTARWIAWLDVCCDKMAPHSPVLVCDPCHDWWVIGQGRCLTCKFCQTHFHPSRRAFTRIEPYRKGCGS